MLLTGLFIKNVSNLNQRKCVKYVQIEGVLFSERIVQNRISGQKFAQQTARTLFSGKTFYVMPVM